MRASKPVLWTAFFLLSTVSSFAAGVSEVLERVENAEKSLSYRGMKVATLTGLATATFKVIHLKPDKTRTEYFAPAPLAGVIVIRNGTDCWRYYPRDREWEQVPCCLLPSVDVVRRDAFANYDIRIVGTDEVAGRPAYIIHAVPRNRAESAHRVWVDKDFYLVMGTQIESPHGTVLNSSRFTSIQIDPTNISPTLFKVTGTVRPTPKPGDVRFKVAKPAYLPRGYRMMGMSSLTVNGMTCAHLQFSNGINTISLFERQGAKEAPPCSLRCRATKALTWSRDGIAFTVMGDLAQAELRKIADSTK